MLKPVKPREPEFLDRLRAIAPDCCPVTAYGALLPQTALDIPPQGWVNLHFSVLPAWRGAAPVQHAMLHGDDVTGATTFQIVRELDAGPVFGVVTEAIRPDRHSRRPAGPPRRGRRRAAGGHAGRDRAGDLGAARSPPMASASRRRSRRTTPGSTGASRRLAIGRLIRACTPGPGRLDRAGRHAG